MPPLKRHVALEIEFHRKPRYEAPGTLDPSALHTSYALQSGYEPLWRQLGPVTAHDLDRLADRLILAGEARKVLVARDSFRQMLDLG